jgi:uncharacterized NAD-dependent epimerase/dehydratase family protein
VGIAVNTSKLSSEQRTSVLKQYANEFALPCVDPLIDGVAPIVDRLCREFS